MPGSAGRLASDVERAIADGLRKQTPIKGLPGVTIENVRIQPEPAFDIAFEIRSGSQRIPVFAEVKPDFSPRRLAEITPWIQRLKSLRQDVAIAVAAPSLSPQSQAFCIENGLDFFDLAGNVFVNVPGTFTLQRIGMRDRSIAPSALIVPVMNVFSGRTSRVLRVLLEKPGDWSVKGIADELTRESERLTAEVPEWQFNLRISMGTVSKAIASLEEQLWIRRLGAKIVVPEPARLLRQWADKYKERYRWRLRDAVQVVNPFGANISTIAEALGSSVPVPFAATGAAAVADVAPWVEADVIDLFTPQRLAQPKAVARRMNNLDGKGFGDGAGIGAGSGGGRGVDDGTGYGDRTNGPPLRFIVPFDAGVFMYCRRRGAALEVSLVQAYLDLYARGGRDLKQAEHLLEQAIAPRWSAA
ncbi:MAG TPA: hypothetical protein VNF99_17950 [Stellaceae bacterium]|nr:hypothetical protein [Stellaceae bacterium]